MLTTCPACQSSYEIADRLRGSNVRCPHCERLFMAMATATEKTWIVPCAECGTEYEVDITYVGDTVACEECGHQFVVTEPQSELPPILTAGETILDRFAIRQSWPGSIGPIYRVTHNRWELDLIIKTVRPGYLHREGTRDGFLQAVDDWVNLGQYPHLACCYFVREVDGQPWLFIEYVNGGRLTDWIADGRLYEGPVEATGKRLLHLAHQVASALAFAHEKGILHGQVSTHNVMLSKGGNAKLTDFGLYHARFAVESPPADAVGLAPLATSPGTDLAYCSLEQYENDLITPQTDLWSWALVVLETYLGRRTWEVGATGYDALLEYLDSPAARQPTHWPGTTDRTLPPMPEQLAALVRQCFHNVPEDRPHNMHALVTRLGQIIEAATGEAPVEEDPNSERLRANTLNNRAVAAADWGEVDSAEQTWEQALQLCPGHVDAYFNLLVSRWRRGGVADDEVLTRLTELGAADPDGDRGHLAYLLSLIHLERGDAPRAIGLLEQAVANRIAARFERAALRRANRLAEELGPLTYQLVGHQGEVLALAVSMDSRHLVSCGADGPVRVWDLGRRVCLHTLSGHRRPATSVALSPNGRLAVSAAGAPDERSAEASIRLWDIAAGQCLGTFGDCRTPIARVAFSPDGANLLAQTAEGRLQVWNFELAEWIATVRTHAGPGYGFALAPDGQRLYASGPAAAGESPDLAVWDLASGMCLQRLAADRPTGGVIALSADGGLLLAAAAEGTGDAPIYLWDTAAGRCVGSLLGHAAPLRHLAIGADRRQALSLDLNGLLRQWDLNTGKCLHTLLDTRVQCVDFLTRAGALPLIVAGVGHQLQGLCLGASAEQPPALSLGDHSPDAATSADRLAALLSEIEQCLEEGLVEEALDMADQVLASPELGNDDRFRRARRRAGRHGRRERLTDAQLQTIVAPPAGGIVGVCLAPGGDLALTASSSGSIAAWEVRSGELRGQWQAPCDRLQFCYFAANGQFAISAHSSNAVVLWDFARERVIPAITGQPSPGTALALSFDASFAAVGCADPSFEVWDLTTRKRRHLIRAHRNRVTTLDISADGLLALSGSIDQSVKVWEVATGRSLRSMENLGGPVRLARFTADGRAAIIAVDGQPLRLWDLMYNRSLHTFGTRHSRPESASLSADRAWAVTAERAPNPTQPQRLHVWKVGQADPHFTLEGLDGMPLFTDLADDGSRLIASNASRQAAIWELTWKVRFDQPRDWDDEAWPFLRIFLSQLTPWQDAAGLGDPLLRQGQPTWQDADIDRLMRHLQSAGLGHVPRMEVTRRLDNLASIWDKPKSTFD